MEKVIHELDKKGAFYFLANAFIGAYNRRTDALVDAERDLAKWFAILARALTAGQSDADKAAVLAEIDKLKNARESLEQAEKSQV